MTSLFSFPPLSDPHARILILGTMPGEASLKIHQYYGHRRNQFWPIMASILGFDPLLSYQQRVQALVNGGLALWDIVAECERQGSLDSAIEKEKPNKIRDLLLSHREIHTIVFNGGPAHRLFRRHFRDLADAGEYHMLIMPSTSPACARYSFDKKLALWRQAISSIV
jgi:double-stranded uracil-DNA glycosylase